MPIGIITLFLDTLRHRWAPQLATGLGRHRPDSRSQGLLWLGLVLICAFAFRVVGLDHLPGLHGDEGHLGTRVALFLQGDPISLRTSSDRYADPISFGLYCGLYSVFGSSIPALRTTAAITGVLHVVLLYVCARRHYGKVVAHVAAALGACMPTAIAYSRFCWEPSQSPLVCSAWLFAALSRNIGLTILAGMVAVVVHPTNVFLMPVIAAPYVEHLMRQIQRKREVGVGQMLPTTKSLLAVIASFSVLAVIAYLYDGDGRVLDAASKVGERLTNGETFREFLRRYPGLFTGATVYAHIVRPLSPEAEWRLKAAFVALFVLPLVVSLLLDWRRLTGLTVGLLAAISIFYLLAGPEAIVPNAERYAMWMLSPHCLVAAVAWHHVALRLRKQALLRGVTAAICSVWLVNFYIHYFSDLTERNSVTELSFATGTQEPKQAALTAILAQKRDQRITRIYTEDWWTYWAIKYLSLGERAPIEVTIYGQEWNRNFPVDFILPPLEPQATRAFYVGYAATGFAARVSVAHPDLKRIDIVGYGGTTVLAVLCSP